jgi:amino acid transporter
VSQPTQHLRNRIEPLEDPESASQLKALGIQPVLARRMTGYGNFAVSFSVISILSGCMTLFGFGMNTGGPAVMFWGWIGVGGMVMLVGLALGEVTSAYPTSGALYFMADRLAPANRKWGWYTGWLNLLGLVGAIAGIDYGASQFIGAFAALQWGFHPTPGHLIGIYAVVLALHAGVNMFGVNVISMLNAVSVWWHLSGVALIVGVLYVIPDNHQDNSFVFTHFVNGTGFHSGVYTAGIGLLLAGYTFSGYDASCHLSEETAKAAVNAPRGIVRAIGWSWLAGAMLLFGLLISIQDYTGEATSPTGVPPAQIFIDAAGTAWAKALLLVVIIAQLFCGLAETAASSRMIFAFSRDGALPFSRTWRKTNAAAVPVNAVGLSVGIAFVLALPALWNAAAYGAVTSINVVGITPAYALPILLRIRNRRRFTPGSWNLGRWGVPVAVAAVAWVAFETVLFCLPQALPVTATSFNYAPVALLALLGLATAFWFARGRRGYATPQIGADDALAAIDVV